MVIDWFRYISTAGGSFLDMTLLSISPCWLKTYECFNYVCHIRENWLSSGTTFTYESVYSAAAEDQWTRAGKRREKEPSEARRARQRWTIASAGMRRDWSPGAAESGAHLHCPPVRQRCLFAVFFRRNSSFYNNCVIYETSDLKGHFYNTVAVWRVINQIWTSNCNYLKFITYHTDCVIRSLCLVI